MNPIASPRRRQLLEQLDAIHAQAVRDDVASERLVVKAGGFGVAPLPLISLNASCAARRARAAWQHARLTARGIAIFVLLMATAAGSEHWQVDQPDSWYRADVSHHGKHAAGGVVIGAASYAVVRIDGGSRGEAIAVGVVDGFIVGAAYELIEGRDGRSWVDPVDALWVTAGAAIGATTAAITDRVIGAAIAVTPRQDGFVVAWSKRF